MDILVWILIILLFIASFASLIFPIIPGALVLWLGFLAYHFILDHTELTIFFWGVMIILTLSLFVADVIANSYWVKKYGGSKWGERSAAIGVIVGSFLIPPFGIIIIPFMIVLSVELFQKRSPDKALLAAVGSLLGFLSGTAAKIIIQLFMIIWFLVEVLA
ncbi:DUF456 domain-containing protein [Halobacillus sp. Marseille-Q1614]|uniref:DUF456 domain-containing protein n=1 Tax=Halobacillus sp. Marseille-Q1614 TaxID=2709134 RepID=UPI00156D6793|nr:DUF456 family protein [Halobacillus sp. Marseille-Q1614]